MSRRLSPVEKAIWLVDQEVRQNFVMIARISHPLGAITELNLRKSLDLVQEKYPPLKWKIKGPLSYQGALTVSYSIYE